MIAHSAGSWLIDSAARFIELARPETVTHLTFLDPFVGTKYSGISYVGDYLGDNDWADNYYAVDWTLFTDSDLDHAHNVDITRLDEFKQVQDISGAIVSSRHEFPVEWYLDTVLGRSPSGSLNYGYPLSREAGGWSPSSYSSGNNAEILGGTPGAHPYTEIVTYHDTLNWDSGDTSYITSPSGSVITSGTTITMQTGSPVWVTVGIELIEEANFIEFDADFVDDMGSEGLLAVYWESVLLGTIDERYVLDGMHTYVMALPETYYPGLYALSFRLDPFTEVTSEILIDNVVTGHVVPEPVTLAFYTLATLGLLYRRL